jgi:hypothetical protein
MPERQSGYGYVLWSLLTYTRVNKLPRLHMMLSAFTNSALSLAVQFWYRRSSHPYSLEQAIFYYKCPYINHGFCAWVRK